MPWIGRTLLKGARTIYAKLWNMYSSAVHSSNDKPHCKQQENLRSRDLPEPRIEARRSRRPLASKGISEYLPRLTLYLV